MSSPRRADFKVIIILLFSPLAFFSADAANAFTVVINEIAWMGTQNSYNDEWIELYNNSGSPIDLEDWVLKSSSGNLKINLAKVILADGYYLLEKTDDNSVPEVLADVIYQGVLNNNGENLELYDNFGNLIDAVTCSSGWFAGDNSTKKTMEKKDALSGSDIANWGTSQISNGTPKRKNSLTTEAEAENNLPQNPTPFIYPSGIVINEILPSPEGSDAENEWIEIFNQNNFETDLSGWQIVDIKGKTAVFTLPEGALIKPLGFMVFSRLITKITLNNDGDGLKLLKPDGNVSDEVSYEKAPQGQSYNRIGFDWAWSGILTPISKNEITALTTGNEPQKDRGEAEEDKTKRELAAAGEQAFQKPSFSLFSAALIIAVFSGTIILIVKRKVKNFDLPRKMD